MFHFQVAAEISAPLSHTKKVTMVSSGKGDVGISKLTGEVLDIMEKMPKVVEKLTGINITKVSHMGSTFPRTRGVRLSLQLEGFDFPYNSRVFYWNYM